MVFLLLISATSGFYLPGVAPRDYQEGESVDVKVNKLDSTKTQLPYEYYSLPFCQPSKIEEAAENLGEILSGDVIQTSPYEVAMKVPMNCEILCKRDYSAEEFQAFAEKIDEDYRVNWIMDNIPVATKYFTEKGEVDDQNKPVYEFFYKKGFALGFVGSAEFPGSTPGVAYVHNHVRLVVYYHEDPSFLGSRVVGFEVEPFSIKHKVSGEWRGAGQQSKLTTCRVSQDIAFQAVSGVVPDRTIIWTYDVEWVASPVKWASRWDLYLQMTDAHIHWFSIVNSVMLVLFLSGMVAMIMTRILRRDLTRYNEKLSEEERQEETGWKIIHGDVFRPPAHGGFFSVLVGSGVQVFAMSLLTLSFAVLGFLSPANRGGLMTALLLLFVFMGMLAGYYSTRTFKMFKLTEWKKNTLMTALFYPGTIFSTVFFLNLFVWGEKSSGAIPFGTLVALLALWFGVSVPLVYLGSYFAFKMPAVEPPLAVNHLPRAISPDKPWYTRPVISIFLGGILPFGAVFIEIFFIMSSVWQQQFYYVFGFLFVVFLILILTCAEITIVMCYFQLCNEDYEWWWRSFLTAGSSAVYLFLYSISYFLTQLEIIKFVSALLFFGYMFLVSFTFFVLTGTIGYFATHQFVRTIYGSLKIE